MQYQDDDRTTRLLQQADAGDRAAVDTLLSDNRQRLRQMVSVYWDQRLASRVDPSDVVQEAMTAAATRLGEYLQRRPIPFYPWLRQIAWERLMQVRQTHLGVQKRKLGAEKSLDAYVSDESVLRLTDRFVAPESTPSQHLVGQEARGQVREALDRLASVDREVLVLRYLEQLSTVEAGAVLGISAAAFSKRHMRAIARLRELLNDQNSEMA